MMNIIKTMENGIVEVKGIKVVNTTPHTINMVGDDYVVEKNDKGEAIIIDGKLQDNGKFTVVPNCGYQVNAKAVTSAIESGIKGVKFQRTDFISDEATKDVLVAFKAAHPDVVIIGSMIAAQAYPGLVAAMVAHPDLMRVAPPYKRMLIDTYTVY